MIIRKDIMAKKEIPGRDKPMWLKVGTLTQFDNGGQVIELNHLPGIQYSVFEPRDDSHGRYDGSQPVYPSQSQGFTTERPEPKASEEINLDDIPF